MSTLGRETYHLKHELVRGESCGSFRSRSGSRQSLSDLRSQFDPMLVHFSLRETAPDLKRSSLSDLSGQFDQFRTKTATDGQNGAKMEPKASQMASHGKKLHLNKKFANAPKKLESQRARELGKGRVWFRTQAEEPNKTSRYQRLLRKTCHLHRLALQLETNTSVTYQRRSSKAKGVQGSGRSQFGALPLTAVSFSVRVSTDPNSWFGQCIMVW